MLSPERYIRLLTIILTIFVFIATLLIIHNSVRSCDSNVCRMGQQEPKPEEGSSMKNEEKQYIDRIPFQDTNLLTDSFNFSQCSMLNCFNFSRCDPSETLRVGIVPSAVPKNVETFNQTLGESNLIHRSILAIVKNSKYYEYDLSKACVLIPEDDTLDRDPLSSSFRPDLVKIFSEDNSYGMNYLVFNLYSGTWPDYRNNDFAGLEFKAAMLAKASLSSDHYRPNFDISLPLFSYMHPETELIETASSDDRSLFLTFKGKRYVFGNGSDSRNSLYHLNNNRDIIMLTTCRHGKKWRELSDSRCLEDDSRYDEYDYIELMRESKFCLTPRGRRLGSFRYLEALSYGCIPVVLSDGWVKPFNEIIDWSKAALQYEENYLLLVADSLRDLDESEIQIMRENGLAIYKKYLSTKERIVLTTLSLIEKRIKQYHERFTV